MTEWRTIPGLDGYYEASSDGQIRSIPREVYHPRGGFRRISGRVLKQSVHAGRFTVSIWHHGQGSTVAAHRLVCAAFHGLPGEGQQALHRNDVSTDNRPENLYWGTPSQNSLDAVRNGVHPQTRKTHCIHGHPLVESNLVPSALPRRQCLTCSRARGRGEHPGKAKSPIFLGHESKMIDDGKTDTEEEQA